MVPLQQAGLSYQERMMMNVGLRGSVKKTDPQLSSELLLYDGRLSAWGHMYCLVVVWKTLLKLWKLEGFQKRLGPGYSSLFPCRVCDQGELVCEALGCTRLLGLFFLWAFWRLIEFGYYCIIYSGFRVFVQEMLETEHLQEQKSLRPHLFLFQ